MSEPLLSVRGLDVARGGRTLVTGFELSIGPGAAAAISGPSGSGKSSLLRVLAGLDAPAGGEVRLRGRTPEETGWTRYRRSVQHVPAVPALHGRTIRDALARAFAFAVAGGAFDAAAAQSLAGRAGLTADVLDQDPATLSTGQRLRAGLVRALLVRPDVLLLDEPTAALDDDAVAAMEALLGEQRARGAGLVIVTHDDAQAARLGSQRVRLEMVAHA